MQTFRQTLIVTYNCVPLTGHCWMTRQSLILGLSSNKRNEILLFILSGHFITPAQNLLCPRPKQSLLMAIPTIEWKSKIDLTATLLQFFKQSYENVAIEVAGHSERVSLVEQFTQRFPTELPSIIQGSCVMPCGRKVSSRDPPDIIGTNCSKTLPRLSLYIKSPLGMKAVHWSFRRSNTDTGWGSRSLSLIFMFRFAILRRNRKLVWFSNETSWSQPFKYLSNLGHWQVLLDSDGDQVGSTCLVHGLGEHQALFQSVIINNTLYEN